MPTNLEVRQKNAYMTTLQALADLTASVRNLYAMPPVTRAASGKKLVEDISTYMVDFGAEVVGFVSLMEESEPAEKTG